MAPAEAVLPLFSLSDPATQASPPSSLTRTPRALLLRLSLEQELTHLRIDGVLGEGGCAIVFSGTHVLLGMPIAIKILREPLEHDQDGALRLRREARLCALGGDLTPRVIDARDLKDGTPYFVMARCQGEALSAHADRCDLSVAEVAELACALLEATDSLHQEGIVHRDIKPENVMIDGRADGRPRVRLIDLGLAKVLDDDDEERIIGKAADLTQPGTFVGTPGYIAPEQLMARKVDERADIYSAGATIYHLLTGTPPFYHHDMHMALAACLRDPLTPISTLRRGVPETFSQIVERALARKPEDRFDSAFEMLEALRAVRDELPVGG